MSDCTAPERCILKLLATKEQATTLELVKESNGDLARGTIYVWLDKLQDEGLVNTQPAKRTYWITDLGRRMLRDEP